MAKELLLPLEDTEREYYVVTDNKGGKTTKKEESLTTAEREALNNNGIVKYSDYPVISVDNGKVSITGSSEHLNKDIVKVATQTLKDYYKGVDLSNQQNLENFEDTISKINEQVKSNIQYQEYSKFLDESGFSDDAYRNYALAKETADPKTSTNLLNSKKKIAAYDKNGNLLTGDNAKTAAEWFEYWKENYTPEERIQLWLDSIEALSNPDSDDALYKGIPYILMGQHEVQNVPAGILNTVNIFNNEGFDDAKVYSPIYGFDDVDAFDAFLDSFASTNKEAFYRMIGYLGSSTDPLQRALGAKYPSTDISTPEKWGENVGINGVTYETIGNISKDEWNRLADLVNEYFYTKHKGGNSTEVLINDLGKEDAAKVLLVKDFSTLPSTMGREKGYEAYQRFQDNYALQQSEGYKSPYEKWGREREEEMSKHLERLGTIAPNATTLGIVSGTIARIVAEQAALALVSGGALTASNIANTLTSNGWKLASNALTQIKLGQIVASKAPRLASAIHALAVGGKAGAAAAAGAGAAAKAIYTLGSISTWAVRELGEDVIRGLVDDAVTANSFDSQGNLDPNKLAENVYMNAVMWGIAKGVKSGVKGLSSIVGNAKTRSVDGVEISMTQKHQLDLLQKALDDQDTKITFHGFDGDGHPIIADRGATKVLDKLTASGDVAKEIDDIAGTASPSAARTIENVLDDENIPGSLREKISSILEDERIDQTKDGWTDEIKTKLQDTLTDDEIRQAFPDGIIKVGDDIIKVDTKDFTAGDINRVGGQDFKSLDDAIKSLDTSVTVKDFTNSINGVMRTASEFATNFKNAVQEFADANNMNVRDVMIEMRNSRIAGEETIPGLRAVWEEYWKPTQDKLLDIQEKITGVRPPSYDFYFRDMIAGTFKPSESGSWAIDQSSSADILGGKMDFDLAASSFAKNTGKLGEIAPDKLEYDPETLAREFVASRIQTIWESDEMGKIYATMQEAHAAGEYDLTEEEARISLETTERVANNVGESDGVKAIETQINNVTQLGEEFSGVKIESSDGEVTLKQNVDDDIKATTDEIAKLEEDVDKYVGPGETLDQSIKGVEEQLARDEEYLQSLQPKTDAKEVVSSLDYETRKRLVEKFVKQNPEYIAVYRNQNTGIDDWYSNGTGRTMGDPTKFESYGSDKGDLTDAVWLTTDKNWAEGGEKSSAGAYNGDPDKLVIIPIKKSLIVDAGGEFPSAPMGKGDMVGLGGNEYYSLRKFSQINDDRVLLTRSTQKDAPWTAARDANRAAGLEPVNAAMRDRLNPKYYDHQELVLFRDTQPNVMSDGQQKILDMYNAENKVSSRIITKAKRSVEETKGILDNLLDYKQKIDAANAKLAELEQIKKDFAKPKTASGAVEAAAELSKKQAVTLQKSFNNSASKSTAAEDISKSSGYKRRGARTAPGPVVGVNYMPSNPFGKFSSWVNDHFVKANSIKMKWTDASGKEIGSITAYNGGYKMYAEAGTFARNVIVDIQRGSSLWEAINSQIRDNGFFIEPTQYQKQVYGALSANEQAAKATDRIMGRIMRDDKVAHVFNDDGTIRDTAGLISMLTTRFRGQGINDFTKFVRKADWDSFTKGEQSWLNKRMYEMTASVNKKTAGEIIKNLMHKSMGLRYRSNMYFNYKNGQLQLTECQRLYTMNKIGDFGSTLKRLLSDSEYRQKVSDYTYIYAAESIGRGLTRADLNNTAETFVKVGAGSTMSKNGMFTDIDTIKAKFGEIDDSALASIEGGEYAKNYILIAGFVAAGEKQGLEGTSLDVYVRNRFNTEALAGTKVGKIGLTDSTIGQFAFMYLGFPIRELTLQWHTIRGGGLRGDFLGSVEYLGKMLGAKGLMWAAEAPWGYSLMDQLDIDPFGWSEQYNQMPNGFEEREPVWRWLDMGVQYNPFFQGAMTSALADIYLSYRSAEETAREKYKEEHNGSTEGFEWSLADAGGEMWADLMKGLIPGYTAYSRAEGEMTDLDRGYRISQNGNRMYEANTDLGNVVWGTLTGRRNTANAQEYYQTANPIRGLVENGLGGLGQQILRANPLRGFREFDPIDSDTYRDWFNGSYQDQQNWNTGIYAFRDEAQEIRERYDKYASAGTAVNDMNSRENELADLRDRVELFVNSYMEHHPEGISSDKQRQLINIFNLSDYQPTLEEAFQESQGEIDYSDWQEAKNRYSQGNFPTAYGIEQSSEGENTYAQSPQLQQVLSQQRYGVNSEVAPMIKQLYNEQKFDTPAGEMTMKDYHDSVYAQLQDEWNKSNTDYDKVNRLQEEYLKTVSQSVIEPILDTYGSSVLSAGKSSDIMQEFGKMLYAMVPSDQYRINKKGKTIYQSTPYMTIDIPKWLNANYGQYKKTVNTTNRATSDRLDAIRSDLNAGRTASAKSKARALIQDIGGAKASVSRDELEWLQGVLND